MTQSYSAVCGFFFFKVKATTWWRTLYVPTVRCARAGSGCAWRLVFFKRLYPGHGVLLLSTHGCICRHALSLRWARERVARLVLQFLRPIPAVSVSGLADCPPPPFSIRPLVYIYLFSFIEVRLSLSRSLCFLPLSVPLVPLLVPLLLLGYLCYRCGHCCSHRFPSSHPHLTSPHLWSSSSLLLRRHLNRRCPGRVTIP